MSPTKTFVFLHGGPGFKDYLRPFFADLGGHRAIFYDQLSGPQVTVTDLLAQLDDVVSALGEKVILCGHSWGAVLGIEYAAMFPEKTAALVVMSSGLNFTHWKHEFELEKEQRGLIGAPAEEIFLSSAEREEWKGFLDSTWEGFSGETFDSLYHGYVIGYDLGQKFAQLKIPIRVIFGSEDLRFPARVARTVAGHNSKAQAIEIFGAGHFPFLKARDRRRVIDELWRFAQIC